MEGNLKKEFKPRDVARMRNLITGKTGDKRSGQLRMVLSKQLQS